MKKSNILTHSWDKSMDAVGAVLDNRIVQKVWEANPLYRLIDYLEEDFEKAEDTWLEGGSKFKAAGYALKGIFEGAAAVPFAVGALACVPLIEAVGESRKRLKADEPGLKP